MYIRELIPEVEITKLALGILIANSEVIFSSIFPS